jgi:ribosomal-protein-alanine N-acetyltransferase
VSRAPEEFRTARLFASRPVAADEEFLVSTWSDARVTAWLGGARDRAGVRAMQEHWDDLWDTQGLGCWILRDREVRYPVGWVLLHPMDFGGETGIEVGWTIVADRWREGLASEAAAEVVRIAFEDCDLDAVLSGTMIDNAASRGVMEKLGFTYGGEVEHAGLPHVLYRLDRTTWGQRDDG